MRVELASRREKTKNRDLIMSLHPKHRRPTGTDLTDSANHQATMLALGKLTTTIHGVRKARLTRDKDNIAAFFLQAASSSVAFHLSQVYEPLETML